MLKNLRALNTLGEPTGDTSIVHLVLSKLHSISKDKWDEKNIIKIEKSTLKELINFLTHRAPNNASSFCTSKHKQQEVRRNINATYSKTFYFSMQEILYLVRNQKHETVKKI